MKPTLSELNNASIIILDANDFLKIRIDKKSKQIIELVHTGEQVNRDITKDALNAEADYSIGDISIGTPYSLGIVTSKLLKGTANNKCRKMLSVFDEIILE